MTAKIKLSKYALEDLYLNKNLSTYKIAKKFNCDPSVIQNRLKEYSISLRNPKKEIKISKEKLIDLYIVKKLSTQRIARILGISSCSVYYKLKKADIKLRSKNLLTINKEELQQLYIEQGLSLSQIAKKLGYSKVTIFNKLKKLGIKTRNLSLANTKYPKKSFDGNNKIKAYMIGFRLGDLNVKAINNDSTVFIKSSTTKKEQSDLIKTVYGKYGHFRINLIEGVYSIYCNLNSSFYFLIQKKDQIENWIFSNDNYFFAFLGGYSDAEGNFGVYSGMARFRLGTYDKNILMQAADKLNKLGIITKFNLEGRAIIGKQNQDFYRISINEKKSLLKFIKNIKPFILHKKRFNDLILCENNILERNKKHRI
ncbi:hypothetical protein J4218_01160 [Candidatus Pacearchaeota archaeon]|nr:hypothetical protein [Candidatus Pacearchaeota archaeon]